MPMPTLNVYVQIYMNNKKKKTFIKIKNISLLFRSFVSVFESFRKEEKYL